MHAIHISDGLVTPNQVKPKHLESLQLDAPTSARAARIGAIPRKHTTYDVWSIGTETTDDKHTPAALAAGAEEMRGLSCLLPRKRKGGKLYVGALFSFTQAFTTC